MISSIQASSLSAIALSLCIATQAWGFPGSTPTLDQCWEEAALVVYAEVVSAQPVDHGQDVVLKPIEVLKNTAKEQKNEISVVTRYGGCPYPFDFRAGTKVIAFLVFHPDYKKFQPWGTGCIEVDQIGYPQYAQALKELPGILKHEKAKRRQLLLDWYVGCAAHPTTREDGAHGISMYRKVDKLNQDSLTGSQKELLLKSLISESPPGAHASSLVYVLREHPSRALDLYLLECLRRCYEPGWKDLASTAVERLPQRLGVKLDESTQKLLDERSELLVLIYNEIDRDEEPETFAQEKARLDILFGFLSAEIYRQCQQAISDRK